MKSKFLILSCFLTLFLYNHVNAASINGSGKMMTRVVKVADFNAIVLTSSADVEISRGNTYSVVLTDYENLIDAHAFRREGDVLRIGVKPNISIRNSKARIKITVPGPLYSVKITGSGDVVVKKLNTLKEIAISGSGDIKLPTGEHYNNLNISVSGSGDVEVNGSARITMVSLKGSGDVDLGNLKSESVDCQIVGSGDVDVYVLKKLKVSIAGSGDVVYYGNPQHVEKIIRGSGTVRAK